MKIWRVAFISLIAVGLSPIASAQDAVAGERLFRQRCGACHTVHAGQNRIGPSLNGIFGRKAGSVDGARYTQGMTDLTVIWDAAQIDRFITNPRALVPGTTMSVSVPNPAERANILAYLQGSTTSNQ